MHTSRHFAFITAMAMVVVGGCSRQEPRVAMLPDTPESMRSARPNADGFPPTGEKPGTGVGAPRDDIRALEQKFADYDRRFTDPGSRARAGNEPQGQTSPERASPSPSQLPSPRPLARPHQDWATPPARPLTQPPAQAARPADPVPLNKDGPGPSPVLPPQPQPQPGSVVVIPATQPNMAYSAKPAEPPTVVMTTSDSTGRDVARKLKEHPTDPAAQLNNQLLRLVREEPVPLLEALTPLPLEDREIISAICDALSNFRYGIQADPTALPSRKVQPLLKLAERLRELTELSIPTMSLCRRVDGFGIYDPMPLSFRAGLEHETIIYCEVDNFSSRLNDKQQWETKLSMEAVLYDSEGKAHLRGKDNVPTDLCRNRRHDFFVVKRLKLPSILKAGRYILKVTIVDEQAQRVAENSLNIMILAQ